MKNQSLEVKAAIQISKTAGEVYEAIVDPSKMSNYLISEGSGRMEDGKTVKNKYISFFWDSDGIELSVEMTLTPKANNSTLVSITEKGRDNDEAGIKWLRGNTEGWANFLGCLKAWLEYGINLRKGAFDYMSENK